MPNLEPPADQSTFTDKAWNNRNAMQKTAGVGLAGGLALGLIGVPSTVVALASIGCCAFYGSSTKVKGIPKIGMVALALFMSIATLSVGGMIGSSISGKEWLPSDSSSTADTPTSPDASPADPTPTVETAPQLTETTCVAQQGKTLVDVENALGQGKLITSSAGNEYMPATKMYKFGNAMAGGACSIMFQNDEAKTATFVQF